jgi:hypothetical protein
MYNFTTTRLGLMVKVWEKLEFGAPLGAVPLSTMLEQKGA